MTLPEDADVAPSPALLATPPATELTDQCILATLASVGDPARAKRLMEQFLESNGMRAATHTGAGLSTAAAEAGLSTTTLAKVIEVAASKPGLHRRVSSPLPVTGLSKLGVRPYAKHDVEPEQVDVQLLTNPTPVFHGKRNEKERAAADLYDFPLRVVFDGKTSGLESTTKIRVEKGDVLGGRYRVLQYLGSGTFCKTVLCEDMRPSNDQHRLVCVKISKNTKDIFDQNLWEVKLLKLLHEQMGNDLEAFALLPALLDVFYFRETLFTVFELLRDNLYTIYKYVAEKRLPIYFTPARCREVARQVLLTLKALHAHGVIHADLKPENILIESLAACRVKVIDYGNAYLVGDEHCSYVQSRAYRAPEVVLGVDYSPKADLWSVGCIMMELATGKLLFDNSSVQALLASHIAYCGAMPSRVLRQGKLTHHYFQRDKPALFIHYDTDSGPVFRRLTPFRGEKIADVLKSHGINDPQFASFVCDLLTLDPEKRPSAATALEHPWLAQGAPGEVEPYLSDALVSEETRLGLRYPSLREYDSDAEDPDAEDGEARGSVAGTGRGPIFDNFASRQSAPASLRNSQHHVGSLRRSMERLSDGSIEDEVRGPLTPSEFRSKAYSEREQPAKGQQPPPRSQRRGSGFRLKQLLGISDKGKRKPESKREGSEKGNR